MKYQLKYITLIIGLFALNSFGQNNKLTDNELLDSVQYKTFQYFWAGAEATSGLARERYHADNIYPQNDKDIVTSGGGGFGVMAIVAGIDRGFITRDEGVKRLEKIVTFLEKADTFHGVFPHWWHGPTGKVQPFSKNDNGGDLVETSFMASGLIAAREYLKNGSIAERRLAERMNKLWENIEFDWYTNGQNVLYWHWSPDKAWAMNFPVHGYNECLIMYVLAASSPTHSVSKEVFTEGWAENGAIVKPHRAFGGIKLNANHQGDAVNGGPLFWAHYSFLGLSPEKLKGPFINYDKETRNQALINYKWCFKNPNGFKGYGKDSWGLTSSYSINGYSGHAPQKERDIGVISPTAAVSSLPYTPKQSMRAIRHWYEDKPELLGEFGFYDAFSESAEWMLPRYLAIDQGPEVVMIENYRSGLLWNLFMNAPEIQKGLKELGFKSPYIKY